ncbi:MAG: NADH-quinone oxidoreductase subunit K [Bdellovibrionales bacterium GWA2_49_15]|nr:MAG: NADH-quinone oxidoreductase subunit K [Bdellovibrionales bacterium GWA2_49_15]HAZ12180.1 NADH-quinone oxidoreductase subunit NuoK [Bdellovibrionales bacterium]
METTIQVLAAFLFALGLLTVMVRRNTIIILMGIEMMLNAANLSLVGFAQYLSQVDGQIQVFFTITIAAAESAIGLSILVNLYRHFNSIKTENAATLKG